MVEASDKGGRAEQAAELMRLLRRHPRIEHQGLITGEEQRQTLERSLPHLVPFQDHTYHGFLPVLDWDHRLPSQAILLRIYSFYSADTLSEGEEAFEERARVIAAQDTFPEFDVPDFANLLSDETYEGTVDPSGAVQKVQLISQWCRNIEPEVARAALKVVRGSAEYKQVSRDRSRPEFLGDLEATKWTPPCEGGQDDWTVDVWYFTEYNGVVARGLSFLVDRKCTQVLHIREFVVRTN